MSIFRDSFDRWFYPDVDCNWDDEVFRDNIISCLKTDYSVLDYGAGRGNVVQMNFRGTVSLVCGVDPDEGVLGNPYLDEGKVLDLSSGLIPYPDGSFDVVFSDNVMEHVQDPEKVLLEIKRVLKPGGVFLAKTPNKWHYMPVIARLTPNWFHVWYNKIRGRKETDTFPTVYRLNTKKAIKRFCARADLAVKEIDMIEKRPEYLRVFFVFYLMGIVYERIVNLSKAFSFFRCLIIFIAQKPL